MTFKFIGCETGRIEGQKREALMNFAREAEQLKAELSRMNADKLASALYDAYDRGRKEGAKENQLNTQDLVSYRELLIDLQAESINHAEFRGETWNKVEDRLLMTEFANFLITTAKAHYRTLDAITSRYRELRKQGWNPWRR